MGAGVVGCSRANAVRLAFRRLHRGSLRRADTSSPFKWTIPATDASLRDLAFGGSDEVVHAARAAPKSLGHEVTFAADTADPELLAATVLDLADRTSSELRRKGHACRTLTLKLRDQSFRTRSRQCTLPAPTSTTSVIHEAALTLLAELHAPGRPLRLVGLTLSGLSGEALELDLGDSGRERACEAAIDAVRARYGSRALRRAGAELAPYRQRPAPAPRPGGQSPET